MGNAVEQNYKDKLFRRIFKEKDKLLSLYNAVNKSNYTNAEELEIVTLENAVYMNMKNDLAFLIDASLNIYEHQSTFNPNMPLRSLIYVAKEYQKLVVDRSIYSSVKIKLPTPRFIVFYNGTREQPEKQVLKLSDAYETMTEAIELELNVTMLNINPGYNEELLEACRTLKEYVLYVDRVRRYVKEMPLEEAVERAITECIRENILKDYLLKYRAEAREMSILEYDEERERELMKREIELIKKMEREDERRIVLEKNIINLVYKKILKNKSLEQTADELEEEIEAIKPVYDIVKSFEEGFDCDAVYEKLHGKLQ